MVFLSLYRPILLYLFSIPWLFSSHGSLKHCVTAGTPPSSALHCRQVVLMCGSHGATLSLLKSRSAPPFINCCFTAPLRSFHCRSQSASSYTAEPASSVVCLIKSVSEQDWQVYKGGITILKKDKWTCYFLKSNFQRLREILIEQTHFL